MRVMGTGEIKGSEEFGDEDDVGLVRDASGGR